MSKKSRRKMQQKKRTDPIQITAIVVIVLIAAVLAWRFIPRGKSTPQAVAGTDNGPACVPFASIPAAEQYDQAPPMSIDASKQYFATFKMQKGGQFVVQLYPDKAPITVNNFVFLSCKGFYNGVTFHRVLEGFMAQGGDPTGTGTGGPGYKFQYEGSDLKFDKAGVVAMANNGPATPTNGSQFFITFGPAEHLNGGYTIFGQVTEGIDVVNGIKLRNPDQHPTFQGDVIESITISEQ